MEELRYRKAIREFAEKVVDESKRGGGIEEVILYGSAAAGDYHEGESDIDILVVSSKRRLYDRILDIQTDINVKYGVALSILYDTPEEVRRELKAGSPFIREVFARGVRLYENH